ncbi:putative BLI-3 blue-light-inducible Bli-3 protein [Spinellus fusiger]|nr:putative BLI-3 blue-light-inducible Bli-3 protein [Spinellus fusiger]
MSSPTEVKPNAVIDLDPVMTKNRDTTTSPEQKIKDLFKVTSGIKMVMLTTRSTETGGLVSRAMSLRKPDGENAPADLWFFANKTSKKLQEIKQDPNVNVSYFNNSSMEWVSIAGKAQVVQDQAKVAKLYSSAVKIWYGDLGDGIHTGGPEDPRITLIFVRADTVSYSYKDSSVPALIYNVAKATLTGDVPKLAAIRSLSSQELENARATKTE